MNNALTTWATQINVAHQQAIQHADKAIEFAKQAGALLIEVKTALPHGEFIPWIQDNCSVSPRQAQRYMAATAGKPMAVRAIKNDTVSHLPERESEFVPASGCLTYTRSDNTYFFIEQSTYENHFFVSSLIGLDDAEFVNTVKPVRRDYVELVLQLMGLDRPAGCAWTINRIKPVASALEVHQ